MTQLSFVSLHGSQAESSIQDLARLRIQVFREFPYLYDGSQDYEERYLQTYLRCPDSLVVLAKDRDQIIGASTAIPLKFEEQAFQQPFLDQQIPAAEVMYFGESVLLPPYRGQGIGKIFMKTRLAYAETYPGIKWAAFCAVIRDPKDARRPTDYRALDTLWQSFGFQPREAMKTHYLWREIGQSQESPQNMQFWLRPSP